MQVHLFGGMICMHAFSLAQQLVREGAHVTIVARRQGVLDGERFFGLTFPVHARATKTT